MPSIKKNDDLLKQKTDVIVDSIDVLDDTIDVSANEHKAVELKKILALVLNQTGHDFSMYKKNTINRRIERRMGIHQFAQLSKYIDYLLQNPQEIDLLFNEMLIGVTNFFREPESFEYLKEKIIPQLLNNKLKERVLRIWIPGCSTGEEAYSVAIVIIECLEEMKLVNSFKVHIFATDINTQAIESARQGIYPESISADISSERLSRYFIRNDDDSYQVRKILRELVVFAPQNLIMDPPFIKLDMLCCRNLLIYFSSDLQKKLLPVFHYALNPGGILFLGSSESIGGFAGYFNSIDSKMKIYERKETTSALIPMTNYLSSPVLRENRKAENVKKDLNSNIPKMIQQILMENYTPSAVVINRSGDIIYISGRTGRYLEPSPGKANLNIFAMAREEIRFELGRAIHEALIQKKSITEKLLNIKYADELHNIGITVRPLDVPGYTSELFIVVFEDAVSLYGVAYVMENSILSNEQTAVVMELEGQLSYTREHLQSVIEEMETSQEELKSMNEELQSTNEELQSTNEELKTSREELQSLNEELFTMNVELQGKNDELMQTNNDMKNLINSTRIATVFLDNDLNIKSFTPEMSSIINLIPTDVGRPISDIVLKLKDVNLIEYAMEVLDTLVFKEVEVQNINDCWFNMKVRPYRTTENVIDGVVITFSEITKNKQLKESLNVISKFVDGIMAIVREPILVLDDNLNIIRANSSFYKVFRLSADEVDNKCIYKLDNNQWNIPILKEKLEEILHHNTDLVSFCIGYEIPAIGCRNIFINARSISSENIEKHLILLAIEDITY